MHIKLENTIVKMNMEYDQGKLTPTTPVIYSLYEALVQFGLAVDLDKLTFILTDASLQRYEYEIKRVDGKKWNQVIVFDDESDPLMTFDVSDEWRLSEFRPHRIIRNILVELYKTHRVIDFTVKW